ncbi:YsnF/AvaK domain-containing protein [Methylobacterium oxalidis]|uniref:YsnF/AvaK domain-containing protein n=1 Tax=Methylobacterium oxalidis TaxID=944322 RepID=UPI0033150449
MNGGEGLPNRGIVVPASGEQVEAGETTSIPIVEETARIEKRAVEMGRVRVSTSTETVEQVLRDTLRREAVGVTRVPIDRVIAEGEAVPQVRDEGGVTIIPVLEEVLVVEKRLILKEEVHIHRTASDENVEVPVTLRKQRAVVERVSEVGHVSEVPPKEKTS